MTTPAARAERRPWLLPAIALVASVAVRSFYRFSVVGPAPPRRGPVLFVANHPNSLVDPAFVAAGAGRPVRFLAKAPLFRDRLVGWLVRASGAIPVYRRSDDAALVEKNREMFGAVRDVLASGWAVGIFPEGISHSAPSLARLKTGAARIALGLEAERGIPVAIVPVGAVLRHKGRFRSRAAAVLGRPISWEDLRGRGESPEAVRELTDRIDTALRAVTVNAETWEDLPVIECAEAVYAAHRRLDTDRDATIRRMHEVSEALATYRREDPERIDRLYRAVDRFRSALDAAGLSCADLDEPPAASAAIPWLARRVAMFLFTGPLAVAGGVVFFAPYRLTGWIATQPGLDEDRRATWKILSGAAVYFLWSILLATVAGVLLGWPWAVAAALALPVLAVAAVTVRDRWEDARTDVRRYFAARRDPDRIARLREHRDVLAESLESLRRDDDRA